MERTSPNRSKRLGLVLLLMSLALAYSVSAVWRIAEADYVACVENLFNSITGTTNELTRYSEMGVSEILPLLGQAALPLPFMVLGQCVASWAIYRSKYPVLHFGPQFVLIIGLAVLFGPSLLHPIELQHGCNDGDFNPILVVAVYTNVGNALAVLLLLATLIWAFFLGRRTNAAPPGI